MRRTFATFDAFSACAVATLGVLGGAAALGPGGFRLQAGSATPVLFGCAALGVLRVVYERRDPKLRALLGVALWAIALSNAYLLPMYALARLGGPLRDDLFRAMDHAIGVDVPSLAAWVRARPGAARAAVWVYDSLQPFCLVTLLVSTLSGQARRAERGVLALVLASALTLALHGLLPAVGPWSGGVAPEAAQAATSEAYRVIRSGAPFVIDLASPDPLVAFPSWHVILAVLCAAVLAGVRPLRPVAAAWAALITLSTLLTGWHYAVDVLGALVAAALAFRGAAALQRRFDEPVSPRP